VVSFGVTAVNDNHLVCKRFNIDISRNNVCGGVRTWYASSNCDPCSQL
jgi:hypothetical protein